MLRDFRVSEHFLLQDKLETSSPAQFYARLSILAVAALIERLAGRQYLQHALYGVRPPDLSLRGAKRRGNLAVPYRISRKLRRNRNCLPEIAASACGLLAMAHQGGAAVHQRPHTVEYPCTRRSLTAAAGTRCKRFVRFDRRPVHIGSAGPFSTKQCCFFPQT